MFLEDISFRFVEIFLFLSFYALYRLKGIDKINCSIIVKVKDSFGVVTFC